MKSEVKCYGLHLLQKEVDKLLRLMDDVQAIVQAHRGVLVLESPCIELFVATFIFPTPDERGAALKEIKALGLEPVAELRVGYADERYVRGIWDDK